MASAEYLANPVSVPDLEIPSSSSTVSVRMIDSTSSINIPVSVFLKPPIKGHDRTHSPALCFLITHPSKRNILFDLGMRKDWTNLPSQIVNMLKSPNWSVSAEKHVSEILQENSISLDSIESIIWSHWHFDHSGAPALFPHSTSLIVGPGFKENFLPAYPTNPDSPLLESDFAGRTLHEIAFDEGGSSEVLIGGFQAFDFFDDGSFYLLNAPGHAIGHMCGLARVTSSSSSESLAKDTFVLMGADACHHGGVHRPSPYLPLPKSISPCPISGKNVCPGALFQSVQRSKSATEPFYELKELKGSFPHNLEQAEEDIKGIQRFDADENVFVALAHDDTLLDSIDLFPQEMKDWKKNGWKEKVRWKFLRDFKDAVEESEE